MNISNNYLGIKFLLCVLFSIFFILSVKAQSLKSYEGIYYGKTTSLQVNGKNKVDQKMQFRLQNATLYGDVPKIGKMPGVIKFCIKKVQMNNMRKLSTDSPYAGQIKMMGVFSNQLFWDLKSCGKEPPFQGSILEINGEKILELKLFVYCKIAGISRVPALICFRGVAK